MGNFKDAYLVTMGNEGALANNPNDAGALTYKGIASKYWPKWPGWPIVKAAMQGNTIKVANTILSKDIALQAMVIQFYTSNFWNTCKLSQVIDQNICLNLFDCSVNPCRDTVQKVFQKACNKVISEQHLKITPLVVDGKIGNNSLTVINELPAELVYNAINEIRKENYFQRVIDAPSQKEFLHSWLNRLVPYNHSLINQ